MAVDNNHAGFNPAYASAFQWAQMYRAHGLQVVPANDFQSVPPGMSWKTPRLPSWRQYQDKLVPDSTFNSWYAPDGQHARRDNMGLIAGRASNNLIVIDLDSHKNSAALNWWYGLLEVHNNAFSIETWQQTTGGGGKQIFFHAPQGWVVPTNKTAIGVDIRGQGGFAMLPSSLHESGNRYVWDDGCAPWEIDLAEAPDWLLEAITALVGAPSAAWTNGEHHQASRGPVNPDISGPPPLNAFGQAEDLRETLMRDVVWHAVLELYRDSPIMPGQEQVKEAGQAAYARYFMHVQPRHALMDKEASLSADGRGKRAFGQKWTAAMRQWGSEKMRLEAAKPSPKPNPRPYTDATSVHSLEDEFAPKGTSEPGDFGAVSYPPIKLVPAFPIDRLTIPPRDWVIPGLLLKKNLSVLVAPPGSGKSLLTVQVGIAVGSGTPWAGWTPRKREKVLIINAEDDLDEMRRRMVVAADTMGVPQEELADWVLLPDAQVQNIVIARADNRTKTVVRTPMVEELVKAVLAAGVGTIVVDPFAETFEGDENSNSEVKWAAVLWREVARRTGCALLLVHHTRKYASGMAGDADASRGGGALIGVARILGTLFTMTEEEALAMGVPPDKRPDYVRYDDAKANHSKKSVVRWFEKKSVDLGNMAGIVPGDEVGVLVPWKPPGMLEGVSVADIWLALESISRGILTDDGGPTGQLYGATTRSADRWAGKVLMNLFNVSEKRAKDIMTEWLKTGLLVEIEYNDASQRKPRKGVKVDASKRPDNAPEVFE